MYILLWSMQLGNGKNFHLLQERGTRKVGPAKSGKPSMRFVELLTCWYSADRCLLQDEDGHHPDGWIFRRQAAVLQEVHDFAATYKRCGGLSSIVDDMIEELEDGEVQLIT
jgi:hypothetical protein